MVKRLLAGSIGLILSVSALADAKLDDQKKKASYTIGMKVAEQLLISKDEIDLEALHLGMQDVFAGKKPRISQEEMQKAIKAYEASNQKKGLEQMKKLSSENMAEGKAFLAKNKKEKGVKTLPSGLQYKIIKAGSGASPKLTDTVTTHYHGTLINGEVFDSSYDRGEPVSFPVNGVIKGWTEALQKMKTGGKWKLFIPSELAYGERGAGGKIGPNATLIFDVELLGIK